MKGNSYECLKTVLTLFVVSEYASGGSLADRLRNYNSGEGLPEFEVKKHTKNVLLEVAKIADFGLALTLEQSWTQKQGLRGTKGYMAPESVLKQEYGPDTDIWALGCTVYELITGTPLWKSSNSDEKFDDVLHRIKYEELSFENVKLSTEAKDFYKWTETGLALLSTKSIEEYCKTLPHVDFAQGYVIP
ncbi:hypothetical protein K7X08_030796 [Anisodus acutangulus]|uniref:Protein kinase domain-containing protein n=1 Tax=Anisodus acutangulus TaxID=402998 RepID=A0A9Q1RB07_9SOLA|nr:hypothetical protein K7X08_030796 [Anisodus acutangulus]